MTYYKAVRPDLSSFHDPSFFYTVGKRVRPQPYDGHRELCGPGVLHASERPEDAVRYARWPWRILTVEGKPFVTQSDKCGFRQLTVVGEVARHVPFGPRGVLVERLVVRAEALTRAEATELHAARYVAWDAAWTAAGDAARDAAWAAARAAARYVAWDAAWTAAGDAAWDVARDAAGYVAVSDLIGQHGLTEQHIRTLYQPWQQVIGEPDIEELLA